MSHLPKDIKPVTCKEAPPIESASAELDMTDLIKSIAKVSLSATTKEDNILFQPHDILTTLILSASVPGGFSQITACSSSLPPREIVGNVLQAYLQRLQPARPFVSRPALLAHMDNAYSDAQDSAYSVFLIGTIVATTVVSVSLASSSSALQLYYFSVQQLAVALGGKASDHLRELEAVVALACFAKYIVVDAHAITSISQPLLPDFWHLTGLGIRIAVDRGLHHFTGTIREKELFNAASALEVEAARQFHLPIGLPEGTGLD
ncbi:hypothetical protein K505DRAFT_361550 [Melanomma pulvis-pyrius CBS 109.77]|uniref:Transcription factor domain-containing protein n=1 Tax=Melanomma pulvis-pyrius CBS 109.77 TaxID=1314802 RepID=A0A6A6XBV8_9PLEO|nr:hypothetical protein K505DRAFT_361550 [Melanomma pulvis-pyrius CBS 109.77]